ncbi:MAG: phosphatidylglycerol lysyltransferase domain-containing protein [Desulfovibrionaceae bacterium]
MPDFSPIHLHTTTPEGRCQHDRYLHLLASTPCRSIDYALANIWGWARYFALEWHFEDQLCWLRQQHPSPQLWAPVGDWSLVDFSASPLLKQACTLIRVPEALALHIQSQLGPRCTITEDRDQWEYLYSTEEMAQLPGNRFHKKRNHVNGYQKIYGIPNYRPICPAVIEDVLALEDEWCQWHECAGSPALVAENEAINRVLAHWTDMPQLVGGALYVDNSMVAFSVGEKLDENTLGVHYEKGRNGFRGVYQMMNAAFAATAGVGFARLNRAQDLGEEGLRKAKMSYLPVDFLKKYSIEIH